MCISHLSSFNLTAFTKVSTMIKRSVRFEFGIPTRSCWDNFHLVISFSTWTSWLLILSRGPWSCVSRVCVLSSSTYRYVKTEIWIRCCWLGNLGNRCPVIHKDRGQRSARHYKRGRCVFASGNRSSDQETSHVRRRSIGSVWWVHIRFNFPQTWNEHVNARDLKAWQKCREKTCKAESSQLQGFFT